jgi:hypothetical protein
LLPPRSIQVEVLRSHRASAQAMSAAELLAIACVVVLQSTTPHVSPSDSHRQIRDQGLAKTHVALSSDEARWQEILTEIATGATPWLDAGATLRRASDGHVSETLDMAIQEALPQSSAAVLRRLSIRTQGKMVHRW